MDLLVLRFYFLNRSYGLFVSITKVSGGVDGVMHKIAMKIECEVGDPNEKYDYGDELLRFNAVVAFEFS